MNEPGVLIENLSFSYGKQSVLRDVNLSFSSGVVGLLGPNGAGKTTLMNVLGTLLTPQSGQVIVNGLSYSDPAQRQIARAQIGYLPQRFSTSSRMTLQRHVEYAAWVNGVSDADVPSAALTALQVVQLDDLARRKAGQLSGGQRQRLGIACAIAHQPKLLLLDEPTVGLDPVQRVEIRKYLHDYGQQAEVLVSTHLVEDIATIAERVIVLGDGEVRFFGSVEQLGARGESNALMGVLESGYHAVLSPPEPSANPDFTGLIQ